MKGGIERSKVFRTTEPAPEEELQRIEMSFKRNAFAILNRNSILEDRLKKAMRDNSGGLRDLRQTHNHSSVECKFKRNTTKKIYFNNRIRWLQKGADNSKKKKKS